MDGNSSIVRLAVESFERRALYVRDSNDVRRLLRLLKNQIRENATNKYGVRKYFVDLVKLIQLGHVFVVRWGVIYGLEYVSPRMMRHLIEFEGHLIFS